MTTHLKKIKQSNPTQFYHLQIVHLPDLLQPLQSCQKISFFHFPRIYCMLLDEA